MRRVLPLLWSLSLIVLLAACGGDDTNQETSASAEASSTTSSSYHKVQDLDPEPVPDLTFETLDGGSIALADQDGKVLLINFWATWCAPCRKEIPELNALHSDLKGEGLTVIGVSLDRDGVDAVKPFLEQHEIKYPVVVDKDGTAEAELGPIHGLPTTVVVEDGQITKRVIGIFPVDKMKPTLKEMLATSGSASNRSS